MTNPTTSTPGRRFMPAWALSSPDARERYLSVWSDGFTACWSLLAPRLERAERDADYWYLRANNSPAEIAEIEQRLMDEAAEAYARAFFEAPRRFA